VVLFEKLSDGDALFNMDLLNKQKTKMNKYKENLMSW